MRAYLAVRCRMDVVRVKVGAEARVLDSKGLFELPRLAHHPPQLVRGQNVPARISEVEIAISHIRVRKLRSSACALSILSAQCGRGGE